ncbi:MAG TPA: LuxR family transcriptional regulator [Streptosporangiaceae bacterium]|nr:LuxR family transcriptional regulator [Streptosporangiaceae bacterium]
MTGIWPFVGRADELARAGALLRADAGLALVGEAGIGKTALARQIIAQAAEDGARTGFVEGQTASSQIPFEVFAGVLGDAGGDQPPVHPAEVARRIPAALGARAGERLVLGVDDAHLLDDSSARVLLALASEHAATVVMTISQPAGPPEAVQRLWRDGLCERLDVPAMSAEDVQSLLEAVLAGPVDPRTSRMFAHRAQGNCLLLRELVTAAMARSALAERDGVWYLAGEPPLSSGVREIVAARLAGVGDGQRAAIEIIAAGEPLSLTLAARVVGEPMLERIETARLAAVRDGLGGPEVAMAHPLYGEVIRADMPRLRLRRLRLNLAQALEATASPGPHDLVRAALWRLEAGQADDHGRLLEAARAARGSSLATAERLARSAFDARPSLDATLLLAEIMTHNGHAEQAAQLLATLPPESLTPADREAIVYCTAVGQGLLAGDTGGGAAVLAGAAAGTPQASQRLRAVYALLLAFDARLADALDQGTPLIADPAGDPVVRTLAAIGVVGADYWLGHTDDAVAVGERLAPVAARVREQVPFGLPSMELITVCALADGGDLERAQEWAHRMHERAQVTEDGWAGPRAGYCLGRVALARGQVRTAGRLFRRAASALTPFDQGFGHHVWSMVARAAAAAGNVDEASAALDVPAGAPRMKIYEPEWELARAAVLAASVRMDEAADRAAWVAGVAAARCQWSVALTACQDAARYGGARHVLAQIREAAGRVDGRLARCALAHAEALAAGDAGALDAVSQRFEDCGTLLYAAEAAEAAALAHAGAGRIRAARASGQRATVLRDRCEGAVSPWLAGATAAVPLTSRERQVAALAAGGSMDAEIATRLGISARTVQTHLAHVYSKLGVHARGQLAGVL